MAVIPRRQCLSYLIFFLGIIASVVVQFFFIFLFRQCGFYFFIEGMTDVLEFSKFHMCGDDLQIYHSRSRDMLSECIREVNSNLRANFLSFDPAKFMVLPIYRGN
jgi:hypothetical protein